MQQQQQYREFMKRKMKSGMSMKAAAKEWDKYKKGSPKKALNPNKKVWDPKDQRIETIAQMKREGEKIPNYRKGGKVKKTGLALVHKGERVIPKEKSRKSAAKLMQKHPGGTSTIKRNIRKRTATIIQHEKGLRGGETRYRFPMPDKAHARAALADLPKAKGLSSSEEARIRATAERMLGDKEKIKKSLKKTMGY